MVEEALDEGDRCLVFTQFKEMGSLLKTHLEEMTKQAVLFLHGGVPQKDREDMVALTSRVARSMHRRFSCCR